MYLSKYLAGQVVTEEKIQEAKVFYQMHFQFSLAQITESYKSSCILCLN